MKTEAERVLPRVRMVLNKLDAKDARELRKVLPRVLDVLSKQFTRNHVDDIIKNAREGARLSEKLT